MISSELEKLLLYTQGRGKITLGDVETMVLAAKQRSLYELTTLISARDRAKALALLQGLLNSSDARRGRGHRPSLLLAQDLPADAGDSGKECCATRAPLAGAVAGVQDAALCRRRSDSPGPALHKRPPRAGRARCG